MPDGYKIAPHSHPTDEHVTVLSGTLKAGSGAKWDDASMHSLTAGGSLTGTVWKVVGPK